MDNLKYRIFRSILFAVIILFCTTDNFAQQKVQFTQYMFNGLVINPAYAGADEALSLTFIQRNQWAGVENAPATQTLSAHTLVKRKHVGLGLTLINDKIGVHKNLNVLTNYAYHLQVGNKSYLSMGIGAGIYNQKSDYGTLVGNVNDPKLSSASISSTFFNFAMGLYYRSPKLQIGVSAPELLPEKISINDTLSIHLSKTNFFVFSKYRVKINPDVTWEPSLLFKFLTGVPLSFDINMNLILRKVLTVGLSYRKRESVDFLLKGQVTPQFQFGYAYDHPIGDLTRLSNGSHEIMVNYLFRYAQKKVHSPR